MYCDRNADTRRMTVHDPRTATTLRFSPIKNNVIISLLRFFGVIK